jgi:hypothetical protein
MGLVLLSALVLAPPARADSAGRLDTARIEQLTGMKGKLDEKEGVFKVALPRTDIEARAAGVRITPALGLTAWAAFQRVGAHVMVMGDMVLTEDQVNPVMSAALESGLEVTALHNHLFWDAPKVMFMHIGGMGAEGKLATAVGKSLPRSRRRPGARARCRAPTSTRRTRPSIRSASRPCSVPANTRTGCSG